MATWIGIDISKDTADIGWFEESIKRHFKVTNDPEGFRKTIGSVPADSRFVMEATGTYYLNFALFLAENGRHVSVVNSLRIKNYMRADLQRYKDDKSDSLSMAKFGSEKNPEPWIPVTEDAVRMQQLAGLIDLYGKQIVQQSNQIHAVTRVKFASPDVLGLLKKSMRLLQAGKTEAERAFIELVIITSVGDFRKFTSSRQVVSYLGLSSTRKQSGTSLNSRGPISRMGGCRMRSFL
jgi:transposase